MLTISQVLEGPRTFSSVYSVDMISELGQKKEKENSMGLHTGPHSVVFSLDH